MFLKLTFDSQQERSAIFWWLCSLTQRIAACCRNAGRYLCFARSRRTKSKEYINVVRNRNSPNEVLVDILSANSKNHNVLIGKNRRKVSGGIQVF